MLKLRLKRFGKKREPSYRIIAIESKSRREARPLEELGFYNPRTKETVLKTASLLKWLRYGATPTDTLGSILRKAGIFDMLAAGKAPGDETETLRIPAIAKIGALIEEEPVPETEVAADREAKDEEGEGSSDSDSSDTSVTEALSGEASTGETASSEVPATTETAPEVSASSESEPPKGNDDIASETPVAATPAE